MARSQQVRFNLGLAKGRRKLAQQYQDAVAMGVDTEDIPIPEELIYSLGGAFPPLEVRAIGVNTEDIPIPEELLYSL